jgi:hypothetical protein
MSKRPELTRERLREILDYDPLSGIFTNRKTRGPAKAGDVAGTVNGKGYVVIAVDGKTYQAHRLAFLHQTGKFPPADVDHINGLKTDNRWSNLRHATRSENNGNHKGWGVSGIRGVSLDKKAGKWKAQIRVAGLKYHLGLFNSVEEAQAVYNFAAGLVFGQFAFHQSQGGAA